MERPARDWLMLHGLTRWHDPWWCGRRAPCRRRAKFERKKEAAMAKKALCIGINDYPGTGMDLSGCVNDAKDWAALLRAKGFKVSTLLDKKATLKGMRAAISDIVEGAKSG